jgi:hypothetical protein
MNSVAEEVTYTVLNQDFLAAIRAYEQSDFALFNVYANRLMADTVFGREKQYGLIGFFLKSLAIDFLRLANNSDAQNGLKPIAGAFISMLREGLNLNKQEVTPKPDVTPVWQGYFAYVDSSRKVFMHPIEKQVYKDNKPFTAAAFSVLSNELLGGDWIFEENSQITKAFLTESERLLRNHGGTERDLVLNSLVTALHRLLDYVKFGCSGKGNECVKSHILPFVERIKEWMTANEKLPFNVAGDILADIILQWRLYFIRYGEIGRAIPAEEKKIELPSEAKKRIGDTIAEALKKDLGRSKAK